MHTMLKSIRDRRESEEGFTLIELMVVVLIIAILIAIAIPTFLGARTKANDRAAQSSLRNALTAAKSVFTDNNTYLTANAATLQVDEPSLTFVDTGTPSTGPKRVSVGTPTATVWTSAALSSSDTCFYIRDNSGAGGNGTTFAKVTGAGGACDGTPPGGTVFSATGW
jgi:type IV pilus assembly protein PilA